MTTGPFVIDCHCEFSDALLCFSPHCACLAGIFLSGVSFSDIWMYVHLCLVVVKSMTWPGIVQFLRDSLCIFTLTTDNICGNTFRPSKYHAPHGIPSATDGTFIGDSYLKESLQWWQEMLIFLCWPSFCNVSHISLETRYLLSSTLTYLFIIGRNSWILDDF